MTPCSDTPIGWGKKTICTASTAKAGTTVATMRRRRPVVSPPPTGPVPLFDDRSGGWSGVLARNGRRDVRRTASS
jgi:hypothetical protein